MEAPCDVTFAFTSVLTVEEAAKLVISAGLVTPEYQKKTEELVRQADSRVAPPLSAAE